MGKGDGTCLAHVIQKHHFSGPTFTSPRSSPVTWVLVLLPPSRLWGLWRPQGGSYHSGCALCSSCAPGRVRSVRCQGVGDEGVGCSRLWLTEKNVGLNQSAFLEESRSACAPAALDPELQLHVLWFEQLLPLMKVICPDWEQGPLVGCLIALTLLLSIAGRVQTEGYRNCQGNNPASPQSCTHTPDASCLQGGVLLRWRSPEPRAHCELSPVNASHPVQALMESFTALSGCASRGTVGLPQEVHVLNLRAADPGPGPPQREVTVTTVVVVKCLLWASHLPGTSDLASGHDTCQPASLTCSVFQDKTSGKELGVIYYSSEVFDLNAAKTKVTLHLNPISSVHIHHKPVVFLLNSPQPLEWHLKTERLATGVSRLFLMSSSVLRGDRSSRCPLRQPHVRVLPCSALRGGHTPQALRPLLPTSSRTRRGLS
ncbi:hypothetical protein CB1_001428028 [Camelus ferus]|nr:hypothetical protein CB1_001428028 [Camelus ferus]